MTTNLITALLVVIAAVLVAARVAIYFRSRKIDLKKPEQTLEQLKANRCAAHDACIWKPEGIVNLAQSWEKPNWKLGCGIAISEAQHDRRDFKTIAQVAREAEKALRNKQAKAWKKRELNFRANQDNARRPSLRRIARFLRMQKRVQKMSGQHSQRWGRHALGWNRPLTLQERRRAARLRRLIMREQADFMKPYKAKMLAGESYRFSTILDPTARELRKRVAA